MLSAIASAAAHANKALLGRIDGALVHKATLAWSRDLPPRQDDLSFMRLIRPRRLSIPWPDEARAGPERLAVDGRPIKGAETRVVKAATGRLHWFGA